MPYVPTPVPTGMDDTLAYWLEDELQRLSIEVQRLEDAVTPAYGGLGRNTPLPGFAVPAAPAWAVIDFEFKLPEERVNSDPVTDTTTLYEPGIYLFGGNIALQTANAGIFSFTQLIGGVSTGNIVKFEVSGAVNFSTLAISNLFKVDSRLDFQWGIQAEQAETVTLDRMRAFVYQIPSFDSHLIAGSYANR